MSNLTSEQHSAAYTKLNQLRAGQEVAIDECEGGVVTGVYIGGSLDGVEVQIGDRLYHFGPEELDRVEPMEVKPSDRTYGHRRNLVQKQQEWIGKYNG
jgi:hypothetical protein